MKRYHQSALRKGRISESGSVYAVVKNIENVGRPLIRDPHQPQASAEGDQIVIDAFRWHQENGFLICLGYTVMRDHYHLVLLLEENRTLDQVMGAIGGFTAKAINRLHGWSGQFWQAAHYDRMVRDDEELDAQLNYVRENPVRAGYVGKAEHWPFTEVFPDWVSPWV